MFPVRITSYAAGSSMAPHHHEQPSLIVVVSGSYRERIQATESDHAIGSMLFYPAFATHSQRFGPAGARKIVFTPQRSSLEFLQDHGIPIERGHHIQDPAVLPLAARLQAEMRSGDEFAPLALDGILLELVAAFARGGRPERRTKMPLWLRMARDLIRERSRECDSLDQIAARLGRHPVQLAREFRRHFGTSVGAYRRKVRVEQAAGMLRAKAVDLTEIALACGFASHSHLCSSFKAAYGVTPTEFRNSQ